MRPLVIGTRGSSLAMCQAQIVQTKLEERAPRRLFTIKSIKAQADKNPEISLTAMSGEGIFVKALEAALMEGQIDLAVHSMKDLPLALGPTLQIGAVLEREEPRDALVSRTGTAFEQLPRDTRVGTSSVRRRSQLLLQRQDLHMMDIRGNVDTRLRKLDEEQYDAIVLAACGLIRLGLEDRITQYLEFQMMLPEPGQGALVVEARQNDAEVLELLGGLDHLESRAGVDTERAFLGALGGGCRVPIAAYASCEHGELELEGAVIASDGHAHVRGKVTGSITEPVALGERLATVLIAQGAKTFL